LILFNNNEFEITETELNAIAAEARQLLRQINFGGHYTKKFGLISNKIRNDCARAERVVALT